MGRKLGETVSSSGETRIAEMNPDAVTEAKVYRGSVHYSVGNGKKIELSHTTLVEVGKWTSEGAEREPADYRSTYYAALLLGYESEWLPYDETGDRKLLIGAGFGSSGEILSFSKNQAKEVATQINEVYKTANNLRPVL